MIQQTITLPLGGQDRTLLYGVNGYFEHIKEATSIDPFEWLERFDKNREDGKLTAFLEDTAVVVYAGLNSHLDSTDQPNVAFNKVKKWCNGLTNEMTTAIYKAAFGTIETKEPGELQPNQGNGEAKVSA